MVCAGFTHVEFRDDAGKMNGAEFPRDVVAAFPCAIPPVLTDNGMAFADLPKNRNGPTRRPLGAPVFDRACHEHGIERRLDPALPSLDQRPSRTHEPHRQGSHHQGVPHPGLESLKARVLAFVSACNLAKHLKALRWRTPFEAVCHAWATAPDILKLNPRHLIPGPNTKPIPFWKPAPSAANGTYRPLPTRHWPALTHQMRLLLTGAALDACPSYVDIG